MRSLNKRGQNTKLTTFGTTPVKTDVKLALDHRPTNDSGHSLSLCHTRRCSGQPAVGRTSSKRPHGAYHPPLAPDRMFTPRPFKKPSLRSCFCEPVWPSGKALGWLAERPRFDPLRRSFLFKNGDFSTLSCDFAHTINEILKCLKQLPTLKQSHSGGDGVASRW